MTRNLRKPAPIKARGGQAAPRQAFWPKFFWYPALILGALIMTMTLKVGVSPALQGHGWQKVSPAYGFAAYAAAHSPRWDKKLTTLTSDGDDDDDGGNDDPSS